MLRPRKIRRRKVEREDAPFSFQIPAPTATVRPSASQFARAGTEALETPQIFSTHEVLKAGGLPAHKIIGDQGGEILLETKKRLFAAQP